MQVDPIKATLKAPGSKRLKLKHDNLLSHFAFRFNLRRYTKAKSHPAPVAPGGSGGGGGGPTREDLEILSKVGPRRHCPPRH